MKKIKALVFVLTFALIFSTAALAVENFSCDFDDATDGDDISLTDMSEYFEINCGNDPTNLLVVEDPSDSDNLYFNLDNFTDLRSYEEIEGEYVFSFDYRNVSEGGYSSAFVRGVTPGIMQKENPKMDNLLMTFNYYEADWYNEITDEGTTDIGGSGIAVSPKADGILLSVKAYCEEAMTIKSVTTLIAYPDGVTRDSFFNIKFRDNGTDKVEILINNQLFATVELSGAGTVYESDETDDIEYFKTAVVKGADGTELMTVTDTRVNSIASQVGVAVRVCNINVDNFVLSMGDGAIAADGSSTPPATETDPPASSEVTSAETEADSSEQTAVPSTSDETGTPSTATTGDDGDESRTTLIIIIVAAVVVAAIVAAVLIMGKNKKKSS